MCSGFSREDTEYIYTGVFDTRLSATIYLIGFNFAKQSAAIFLSAFAGNMYDRIGFQDTYLMLGCIVLTITVISAFTLSSKQQIAARGNTVQAS